MEENPIDKDHITENPDSLAYPHHRGSAVVKPEDKGKIKGRSMAAMQQQTDQQLGQLYEQMKLLADQAKKIQDRVDVSEKIYNSDIRFEPLINHVYHLYQKEDSKHTLSMIGPGEWGKKGCPFPEFISSVKLMADHTWEILE
jgi:hypothetical protein